MIEAIIGRESGRRRLMIAVGEQTTTIGDDYSVPQTISRQQCSLKFDDDTVHVVNLKPDTSPIFVNGVEVISKSIAPTDRLQIGKGYYNVDLVRVREAIEAMPAVSGTYSLAHLQPVWETYEKTKYDILNKQERKNTLRSLGSVFMMLGGLTAAIVPTGASTLMRGLFMLLGVSIMIALLIPGLRSKSSVTVRIDELTKQLRKDYVCPNPKCKRFFGMLPYDEIKNIQSCPKCKSEYHE